MSVLDIPTAAVFEPLLPPRREGGPRFKGAHGGRGSGKSRFFGGLLVDYAMSYPGLRAVCVRETQRSLRFSSKQLIEDEIRRWSLGRYFRVLRDEIRTPGGGVIVFEGMQNHTADSIKSLEDFDIGWIEEAQKLSARSWELLTPTIRKPGSEIWASWNATKPEDPVDAFFRSDTPHPEAVVVEANWRDNPWFPEDLRIDMEHAKRTDPDKWAHVWEGGYLRLSEARVFKNWRVEEFETPDDAVFYFGADWGFSIDPSVLIRCWIDGRRLYVDAEAYQVGCEIDHVPFLFAGTDDPKIRELNPQAAEELDRKGTRYPGIPGSPKWVITADSARPETIAYLKRHGFPRMVPSIKGPGSVEEGIEFLQSFEMIIHPRCVHTIDELTFYSYKTDPQTGIILPKLEDKKNHVIDALRYSIERLRRRRKRAGTF